MYCKKFINKEAGYGWFASQKISAGTTLFHTNTMVAFLDKDSTLNHCSYCFTETLQLKRCSKCKHTLFCSLKCQRDSWPIHKIECSYLEFISESNMIPALIRTCALFVFSSELSDEFNISDLHSHESLVENEKIHEYYPFVLRGVVELLNTTKSPVDPSEVYSIYKKLVVNMFTLENDQLQCIGSALIPGASKLNHSCDPNCVIAFEGRNTVIKVIKDVQPDSELTISYIPLPMPFTKRKEQLYQQYNFYCSCPLCFNEQKLKLLHSFSSTQIDCPTFLQSRNETLNNCSLVSLSKDDSLTSKHVSNIDKINILIDLTEDYISSKNWKLALDTGLEVIPILLLYAKNYPSTGLFLAKIGKIYLEQDIENLTKYKHNVERASDLFYKSLECLCISLSEKHKLRLEVQCLYRNAKDFLTK